MNLQPNNDKPKAEYPSFKDHHISRRAMISAGVVSGLLTGCGRKEDKSSGMGYVQTPAPLPAPCASTNELQTSTEPTLTFDLSPRLQEGTMRPRGSNVIVTGKIRSSIPPVKKYLDALPEVPKQENPTP